MVEGEYFNARSSSWIFDLSVPIDSRCGVGEESLESRQAKGVEVVCQSI